MGLNNPWVWTKKAEELKPDRKAGFPVPSGFLIEGVEEWYPRQAWIQKGYVERSGSASSSNHAQFTIN